MKICIDGLSLNQYNKSSFMEEFGLFLENQQFIDYNSSDDLIEPLLGDNTALAMEDDSMVADIVKTGFRATRGAIRTGVKGYQAANKQWGKVKNKWADIKPRILKLVREFGQSLQNLWHKFMKYDQKYKELGQKIQQIVQFSINSLTELPPVTFTYHQFNVDVLKDMLEYIGQYDTFFNYIFSPDVGIVDRNSRLGIGKGADSYVNVFNAVKANNIAEMQAINEELSHVIARLSDSGDATIVKAFMTARKYAGIDIMGMKFTKGNPDNMLNKSSRERSDANAISASEYVKVAILGAEITKTYNNQTVQEFKDDMVGNNGFLRLVASMVNNNVLSGALKSSGKSIKTETDKMMTAFNKSMQEAQKIDESTTNAQNAQQGNNVDANLKSNSAQTTAERNAANKNGTDGTGMNDNGPQFASLGDKGDVDEGAGSASMGSLTEMYVRSMTVLFTKVAATYQMMIKGVLAATYEIISEADMITYTIERQTQIQKGQVR